MQLSGNTVTWQRSNADRGKETGVVLLTDAKRTAVGLFAEGKRQARVVAGGTEVLVRATTLTVSSVVIRVTKYNKTYQVNWKRECTFHAECVVVDNLAFSFKTGEPCVVPAAASGPAFATSGGGKIEVSNRKITVSGSGASLNHYGGPTATLAEATDGGTVEIDGYTVEMYDGPVGPDPAFVKAKKDMEQAKSALEKAKQDMEKASAQMKAYESSSSSSSGSASVGASSDGDLDIASAVYTSFGGLGSSIYSTTGGVTGLSISGSAASRHTESLKSLLSGTLPAGETFKASEFKLATSPFGVRICDVAELKAKPFKAISSQSNGGAYRLELESDSSSLTYSGPAGQFRVRYKGKVYTVIHDGFYSIGQYPLIDVGSNWMLD